MLESEIPSSSKVVDKDPKKQQVQETIYYCRLLTDPEPSKKNDKASFPHPVTTHRGKEGSDEDERYNNRKAEPRRIETRNSGRHPETGQDSQ